MLARAVEQGRQKRSGSAGTLVPLLSAAGLLGAWGAWVVTAQSIGTTAGEGVVGPGEKSALYYLAHGLGLLCALAAGTIAAVNGQYRRLDPTTRYAFWILQLTALLWALASYGLADYTSFKAFGATGPFVWFSTVLVFAGMDRRVWPIVDKVVFGASMISACLATVSIATTHRDITQRWLSTPVYYMVLLMWYGGWTLFSFTRHQKLNHFWRFIPYVVFICLAVFTKTRSWFLMSFFLLMSFFWLNKPAAGKARSFLAHRLKSLLVLLVALSILGFFLQDLLLGAFTDFQDRALQDTRSGQYVDFFADVPLSDLVLGRGPNGTWDWNGKDYQYFDNAVLWMAFIGGVPTALSYLALIILPGLRCLGSEALEINAAAVLLLLWGLACIGFSTYSNPSLTPYSYLLCLLSGRCLGFLAERRDNPHANTS
ncbi:hypothetical protein M1B72_04880 [Geomonas paludis]|uniref:Uncharacterized protein n=1 Tax=Geomonas paludis TaxID=2740185 RepID=A0A6V8MXQ1_9BACT|nr:hypothetical protein [Geomonas paludis]UPU37045.1 hypothetical protein M1B72_04880 [Geomonas paludis]GFO64860.1 hypothetical protein GMPD_27790 [Geomonas paludis]